MNRIADFLNYSSNYFNPVSLCQQESVKKIVGVAAKVLKGAAFIILSFGLFALPILFDIWCSSGKKDGDDNKGTPFTFNPKLYLRPPPHMRTIPGTYLPK